MPEAENLNYVIAQYMGAGQIPCASRWWLIKMIIKRIIGLSAIVSIMVLFAIEVYYYTSYQELLKTLFDKKIVDIVANINNDPFIKKENSLTNVSICIDVPYFQNRNDVYEKVDSVITLELPYAVNVYLNNECSDLVSNNSENIVIHINSPEKIGITKYEIRTDIIFQEGQGVSLFYIFSITENGWQLEDMNPKVLS
ncbi:MAG: hypothetical protein HUU02_14020 [Bacteroidetes bacterium]|nr:hypothetical protein [Bacteroidota bacterium]